MTGEATAESGIGALEIATRSGAVIVRARPIAQPEVLSGRAEIQRRRRGPGRGERPHRDRLPGGHGRHHRLELGADRVPRTVGSGGDHRALRPRLDRGGRRHRRAVDLGPSDRRTMHRPVSGRGGQRRRGDRRGRVDRCHHHLRSARGGRRAATRRCTPPAVGWSSGSPARARWTCSTLSGRVAVTVPRGVEPALHLVSRSGRVRSDVASGSEGRMAVESFSGSIKVTRG